MTPRIALDLSLDHIAILTRSEDGTWLREGIVPLEVDDMSDRLARMRARAFARVGEGATSILILPDSQILYTSLERDDRDPRATIRTHLKGRTPYAIEDLAFDFVRKGDRLQVAVVANETLKEAETFAADYGFRPVRVVADPETGLYPDRPDFGPTGIASDLLGGARVVLDLANGFAARPAPPPPDDAPQDESFEAALARAETAARSDPPMAPAAPPPTPPVPAMADDKAGSPEPVAPSVPSAAPMPPTPVGAAEEDATPGTASTTADMSPEAASRPDAADGPKPAAPTAEAGEARDHSTPVSVQASRDEDASDADAAPAFSSRRRLAAAATSSVDMSGSSHPDGDTDGTSGSVGSNMSPERSVATRAPRIAALGPNPSKADEDRAGASRPGPGRMALVLTVGLFLTLGAVGMWSLVTPEEEATSIDVASPPVGQEPAAGAEETDLTEIRPTDPDPTDATPAADPLVGPDAATDETVAGESDRATEAEGVATEVETVADVPIRGQASGTGPPGATNAPGPASRAEPIAITPPVIEAADDIRVASNDPAVTLGDAATLPRVERPRDTFRPRTDPAPAAPQSESDSGALVAPSLAGTLAPGGYTVVAGRPSLVPPQRPTDAVEAEDVTEAEPEPSAPVGLRPVPRPDGIEESLAPTPPDDEPDDTRALLRPRPRPEAIAAAARAGTDTDAAVAEAQQSAAIAAAAAAAAASLASRAATAAPEPAAPDPASTPQALTPQSQSVAARPATSATPAPAAVSRQVIRSTGGSVARAATQANELPLRETSLIGVYGQPDARRALVRLSNGRYVKVKVGDRLERGRVIAIGESELRYQRSGRNVVLELPQG
ncbi:hypothetical protein [uncultured Jannaschia sp.]|uniref:hypothetical protein n=1 Tax=uncultured Jannaschia sp. TaxID=293347 RepID=UPI002617C6F0|nr:hypothetical protein [uncultured Jannaschia sp.]